MLEVLGYSVLGEVNTQTNPASNPSGGMAVSWNYTGGKAESDLWNLYDRATTAFQFKQKTGTNTHTDLMTISGNGNVGIGTNGPNTMLDVAGGIHPGAATAGGACAAGTPEGTFSYDPVAHTMVACSAASVWTALEHFQNESL
jgi:hypothetical protein